VPVLLLLTTLDQPVKFPASKWLGVAISSLNMVADTYDLI
jgi:hypothetical protein